MFNESPVQKLARVLQVARGLEADIGVGALTKSEKTLFVSIADLSTPNKPEINVNEILEHPDLKAMPIPTIYKGLRDLQQKGLLVKVGTERSGTYKLS